MAIYSKLFESTYTSGTRDTEPSMPAIRTAAKSEVGVATHKPTSAFSQNAKSWWPWALEQLHEIKDLEPDWDSYGADPIAPRSIALAKDLLLLVEEKLSRVAFNQSRPQIIAPRPDGGVQIEWGTPILKIAVHTDPLGSLGYLYKDKRSGTTEYKEKQNASWEEILQLIATVMWATRK